MSGSDLHTHLHTVYTHIYEGAYAHHINGHMKKSGGGALSNNHGDLREVFKH